MNKRLAFALLAALATSSCGGGRGSAALPPAQRGVKTVAATVTIVIPVRAQTTAARRPRFVSGGTQSVALSVSTPTISLQAFSLLPNAPNCTTTGSARTCVITVDLPIGNDTMTLSTYDGALTNDGHTSGHLLATATATQQIVEGQANNVVISLMGVPATVTFGPQQSIPSNGSQVTVPLTVTVYDASGTQITGSDPFTYPINIQMASANPNFPGNFQFSVNGGAPRGGQITAPSDTIALVYAGRDGTGTYTLTATSNLDGHALGASAPFNVVPGFRVTKQLSTNLANADLVQRYDTRDIWFTEPAAHKIANFSASGVLSEFPVASGKEPRHIVYTGLSGIFFVTELPDTIGVLQANGNLTERSVPTANAGLAGVVYDGGHNQLWFAEQTAAKIGGLSFSGIFTEYPVGIAGSAPAGVALNFLSGGVWFTDPGTNAIGLLKPDHTVVEFPIATSGAAPSVIVGQTTNDTWFAEANAPNLGHIDNATGHITEYPAGDVIVSLIPGASDGFTTIWAITRNGTIEYFDAAGHAVVVASTLPAGGKPFVGTIGTNADLWLLRTGASAAELDELLY